MGRNKQVPLVIIFRGQRMEVGMASLQENGEIVAKVKKEFLITELKDAIFNQVTGITIDATPLVPYHLTRTTPTTTIKES